MQMKQTRIKANCYEIASKQVPKEYGVTVPETIEESCKDFYHVLFVRRTHIPEMETYSTTAYVKQFIKDAWERKGGVKDNLALLGYSKAFIIHDPNKKGNEPVSEETTEETIEPAKRGRKPSVVIE